LRRGSPVGDKHDYALIVQGLANKKGRRTQAAKCLYFLLAIRESFSAVGRKEEPMGEKVNAVMFPSWVMVKS
jgi:hypothetical protein